VISDLRTAAGICVGELVVGANVPDSKVGFPTAVVVTDANTPVRLAGTTAVSASSNVAGERSPIPAAMLRAALVSVWMSQ